MPKKKTWRVHAYFEACASFDVVAETHDKAKRKAEDFLKNLSDSLVDTTVELDGKMLHIEDSDEGIREIDVEEDPREEDLYG